MTVIELHQSDDGENWHKAAVMFDGAEPSFDPDRMDTRSPYLRAVLKEDGMIQDTQMIIEDGELVTD